MRLILVISDIEIESGSIIASEAALPKHLLEECGYIVLQANTKEQAKQLISNADFIVLYLALDEVKRWTHMLTKWKRLPMYWWCNEATAQLSKEYCENDAEIDGLLTPTMNEHELHWALHFGAKQCFERQQWLSERKLLEEKIEERKWIDMAKGILCKIKNVSEAEAYELLRKQAMNERKRMVDVASSIVKVYQLLEN